MNITRRILIIAGEKVSTLVVTMYKVVFFYIWKLALSNGVFVFPVSLDEVTTHNILVTHRLPWFFKSKIIDKKTNKINYIKKINTISI